MFLSSEVSGTSNLIKDITSTCILKSILVYLPHIYSRRLYRSWYLPLYKSWYLPLYRSWYLPLYRSWYLPLYRSWYLPLYRSWYLPLYRSWYLPLYRSWYLPLYRSWYLPLYRSWYMQEHKQTAGWTHWGHIMIGHPKTNMTLKRGDHINKTNCLYFIVTKIIMD